MIFFKKYVFGILIEKICFCLLKKFGHTTRGKWKQLKKE
jgi:hypothetical protein